MIKDVRNIPAMERLEVRVRFGQSEDVSFGDLDSTFRAYLYTPTDDGRMILSEAHFVDGRNEVRPLGTYVPGKDVISGVGSVVYKVKPIAADQLPRVKEFVYTKNFGERNESKK